MVNVFKGLKENINYKKAFKIAFMLTCIFIVFNLFEHMTYADGILDYGGANNPFNDIKSGWGQFIQDQYRNNYSLDSENLGAFDILDKTINGLANIVFYLQVILSWLGVSIFNLCFESNITDAFAGILNSVSTALHQGIFNKFYMIMFMVSLISVLIYFVKKNYAAVFTHIIVVALIVSLSVIIKSDGARTFIVETTGFSREIGESLVGSLASSSNSNSNSDDINTNELAGDLWSNLVHKPWLILEFDGKFDVNDESSSSQGMIVSKKILSEEKGSDEREKAIEEIGVKNISYISRLASSLILFLITVIKLMILIAISVVQVFMQIMGISIVLIAPFLLLLSIVPFFGGVNLIKWMGEKYLEVQVTIVLLSFLIGILLLIDSTTLTFFMKLGASFPVALMIQSVCWIMVIAFRKQLIDSFNKLQRTINGNVTSGKLLSKALDKETELTNKAKDKVIDMTDRATAPARDYVKNSVVNMKEAAESKIKYAKKYATGNAGIKASKILGSTIDKVATTLHKSDSNRNLDEDDYNYKKSDESKKIDLDSIRSSTDNSQKNIDMNKKQENEYFSALDFENTRLDNKQGEVIGGNEELILYQDDVKNNLNDSLEGIKEKEVINLSEENDGISEVNELGSDINLNNEQQIEDGGLCKISSEEYDEGDLNKRLQRLRGIETVAVSEENNDISGVQVNENDINLNGEKRGEVTNLLEDDEYNLECNKKDTNTNIDNKMEGLREKEIVTLNEEKQSTLEKINEIHESDVNSNLSKEEAYVLESNNNENKDNTNDKISRVELKKNSINLVNDNKAILEEKKNKENKADFNTNNKKGLKEKSSSKENREKTIKSANKSKLNSSINKEKDMSENTRYSRLKGNTKAKEVDRVELLKSKLGVTSAQIKEKEKNLKRELTRISDKRKVK